MSSLESSTSILTSTASTDSVPASWKPQCVEVDKESENVCAVSAAVETEGVQTQSVDVSVKDRRLAFARLMPLDIGHDCCCGDMDAIQQVIT